MVDAEKQARGTEHEKEKKIAVEVRTPDGEGAKFHASLTDTVGALKDKAVLKLGITPAPGTQLFLFLGGKRLSDHVTLGEAGVKDDTVLMLTSEPQVGVVE